MTSCLCYWCWEFSAFPPRFQEQSTSQECVEVCRISLHQPHCINNQSVLAWAHSHMWKGKKGRFVAAGQLKRRRRWRNGLFSFCTPKQLYLHRFPHGDSSQVDICICKSHPDSDKFPHHMCLDSLRIHWYLGKKGIHKGHNVKKKKTHITVRRL